MATEDWKLYGFAPVPRDPEVLFKDHPTATGPNPKQDPFTVDDFPLPDTPIVREVRAFAQVRHVLSVPCRCRRRRLHRKSWMSRRSITATASSSTVRPAPPSLPAPRTYVAPCRLCPRADALPGVAVQRDAEHRGDVRALVPAARHRHGGEVPRDDAPVVLVQGRDRRARPHPRARRPRARGGQRVRRDHPPPGYLRDGVRVGLVVHVRGLTGGAYLCRGNITVVGQMLQLATILGECSPLWSSQLCVDPFPPLSQSDNIGL